MDFSLVGDLLERVGKQDFSQRYSLLVNREADNLVLAGEVNKKSFRKFEDIAFENYSRNNNLRISAHEKYSDWIEKSEKIHEDSVEYFELDSSSSVALDILSQSNDPGRSIFVSDEDYKEDLRRWIQPGEEEVIVLYD
jgi:hypothetical protein